MPTWQRVTTYKNWSSASGLKPDDIWLIIARSSCNILLIIFLNLRTMSGFCLILRPHFSLMTWSPDFSMQISVLSLAWAQESSPHLWFSSSEHTLIQLQSQGTVPYIGNSNKLHFPCFKGTECCGNHHCSRHFTFSWCIQTGVVQDRLWKLPFPLVLLNHCQEEQHAPKHYWRIYASEKEITKRQPLFTFCLKKTLWRSLGRKSNRRKKELKVDKLSSMQFVPVEKSIARKARKWKR